MGSRVSPETAAGRVLVEALRLDRESLDDARRRAYEALEVGAGGFLVFGGPADEVAGLIGELRQAARRPLWFAADLERGAGQQFEGCATLPPPAALARHPEPAKAVRTAGRVTGAEARELGINWVLAPVLDLDLMAENPIVGTRSFGAEAGLVARLGRIWIEACQAEGPAACAKHFPGHGRTSTDSHLELPVVDLPASELEDELRPFAEVADLVATLMPGHVAYPSLSGAERGREGAPLRPASRDPVLLGSLLRDRLGFRGLVVSDALIMAGFAGSLDEEGAAAVQALNAGCDVLLYPAELRATSAALAREAGRDPAFGMRLAEAAGRSEALLQDRASGTAEARKGFGPDPGPELADRCLVERDPGSRGSGGGAPAPLALAADRRRPLTVSVISDDLDRPGRAAIGRAFAAELEELGWSVWLEGGGNVPDRLGSDQTVLLLASSPQAFKGRAGLSPEVERRTREEIEAGAGCLVVFGHVRLLDALGIPGLCAWAAEPVMERAAARWLDRAAAETER